MTQIQTKSTGPPEELVRYLPGFQMIPSFTELVKIVLKQEPKCSAEYAHAIASLAQSAYEDNEEGLIPPIPMEHRKDPVTVAWWYLTMKGARK